MAVRSPPGHAQEARDAAPVIEDRLLQILITCGPDGSKKGHQVSQSVAMIITNPWDLGPITAKCESRSFIYSKRVLLSAEGVFGSHEKP